MSAEIRAKLGVVVLNWNGAVDTVECVTSLREYCPTARILVIDNGSTDNSLGRLANDLPGTDVLALPANKGYTGGNNVGIRSMLESGVDVICVLNNDTVLEHDAFTPLVERAMVGRCALSPVIEHMPSADQPWFEGGVLDRSNGFTWPRHAQPDEVGPFVDGVRITNILTGCCILAKADVWRSVGVFDDRFFLNFEDSEWSLRARANGVDLLVVEESKLRHKVSRSFTGTARGLGSYYYLRNALLFNKLADPRPRSARVAWLLRKTVPRMVRDLRGHRHPPLNLMVLAVFDHLRGRYGPAGVCVVRQAARR